MFNFNKSMVYIYIYISLFSAFFQIFSGSVLDPSLMITSYAAPLINTNETSKLLNRNYIYIIALEKNQCGALITKMNAFLPN